jgi:hypothetical protein
MNWQLAAVNLVELRRYGSSWIRPAYCACVLHVCVQNMTSSRPGSIRGPLFNGVPVSPLPLLGVADINDFETARTVFLRAVNRLEQAKKFYVLEGMGVEWNSFNKCARN